MDFDQLVYTGDSSIQDFIDFLINKSPKRIFLVKGKNSYEQCGAKNIFDDIFAKLGCQVNEFFDFESNPKYEDLQRGLDVLNSFDADIIVAVGGGSVMDMAKLLRFYDAYSGDFIKNEFQQKKALIPLCALPTTAGTGCEATHFAVMYKDKVKYSVAHVKMLPELAVIYPSFTYKNSPYLTACTGFDALAQAIEAYWNKNATLSSDEYALKSIKILWDHLPKTVNNPEKNDRDLVSIASYWAGRAINITKTTAPHAVSYPFTSYYGYPHGHAVALSFPFFAQLNFQKEINNSFWNNSRKRILLNQIGVSDEKLLRDSLIDFLRCINLSLKPQFEINREIITNNINTDRLKNNPLPVSKNDIESFLDYLEQLK